MAVPADVRQRIAEIYPGMLGLIDIPEIGNLLVSAVGPQPFSPTRFQVELRKTNWYRSQSESQRHWTLLNLTDPGEAHQRRSAFQTALQDRAVRYGKALTGNQLKLLSELSLQQGIGDVNDPRVMKMFRQTLGNIKGGDVAASALKIRNMAEGQWFLRPSVSGVQQAAVRVASGQSTLEAENQRFYQQAIKRYPHLADELKQGLTLADIVSNQRQIVSEELELGNPAQVDVMHNATWRQLLGIRDPKTNKMRMPTDSEVLVMARDRPEWWRTSKGRQSDFEATAKVLARFGQRAV